MTSNTLPAGIRANDLALSLIAESSDRPLVLHTRVVSGTGGGPEKTILNSPRFLDPLGYDSICVYFRDPNGYVVQRAKTTGDELLVHACDLDLSVFGKRTIFDFARHRRIEHYGLIARQTGVVVKV